MDEKKEDTTTKGLFKSIMGLSGEIIVNSIKATIKNIEYQIMDAVDNLKKSIANTFITGILLLLGFVYFTLGLIFFMDNYLMIGNEFGFLIVGLLILIVGLIRMNKGGIK